MCLCVHECVCVCFEDSQVQSRKWLESSDLDSRMVAGQKQLSNRWLLSLTSRGAEHGAHWCVYA